MIPWRAAHCYPGPEVAKGPVGSSSFVQCVWDVFYVGDVFHICSIYLAVLSSR